VLRHFGHAGTTQPASEVDDAPDDGIVFETDYADERQIVAWVLGLGERARIIGPEELVGAAVDRAQRVVELHANPPELAKEVAPEAVEEDEEEDEGGDSPIRPERFARLVTLAGILISAARAGDKLDVAQLRESLQISETELREDIDVLNVVNFGGGSYVLYAEVQGDQIEVDPEPYGDNFAEPARLLPLEAKALVAAIDLIGEHLAEGSLSSAREKIVAALGGDPAHEGLQITTAAGDDSEIAQVLSGAIVGCKLVEIEYYKENEDEFTPRRIEPYKLMNGQEGWYVHSWDTERDAPRSYRLDRIKKATVLDETFDPRPGVEPDVSSWPRTGEVPASRQVRVWISPERARWAKEDRRVVAELADGAVIVELQYAGGDWLAREILKEAGDAVVIEPDEAREAVQAAAEAVAGAVNR